MRLFLFAIPLLLIIFCFGCNKKLSANASTITGKIPKYETTSTAMTNARIKQAVWKESISVNSNNKEVAKIVNLKCTLVGWKKNNKKHFHAYYECFFDEKSNNYHNYVLIVKRK